MLFSSLCDNGISPFMTNGLMKNSRELKELPSLWSDFLSLLADFTVSVSEADGPESASVRSGLKEVWVDALCERDEMDEFMSRNAGKPLKSGFHHEILDDYEFYLYPETPIPARSLSKRLEEPELFFPKSFRDLVDLYLREFGSDEWGWSQLQRNFFPSVNISTLRLHYARFTADSEGTETVMMPTRWTVEEDYIVTTAIERHGFSIQALDEIYISLDESRSLDDIKTRLCTIYEDLAPTGKRKEKRRVRKKSIERDLEWELDDSLLQITDNKR